MTFPVRSFEREELAGWNAPAADVWTTLDTYIDECKKVDEETRQLAALFDEALKLPAITTIEEALDCPLCGTDSALTPERVKFIREHVENTTGFKLAETAAKAALSQLTVSAKALSVDAESALPEYIKTTSAKRREEGFTVAGIKELLADRAAKFVDPWLAQIRPLVRSSFALRKSAQAAEH